MLGNAARCPVRPWPRRAASLQARGRPRRPQGRSRGDRRRPAGWHCLCRTRGLPAGGGTLFEHIAARGLRNFRHVAAIDCRPRCRHLCVGCRERCAARCGRPGNLRLAFHGARIADGRSVHRRKLPAVGCARRFSIPADSGRLSQWRGAVDHSRSGRQDLRLPGHRERHTPAPSRDRRQARRRSMADTLRCGWNLPRSLDCATLGAAATGGPCRHGARWRRSSASQSPRARREDHRTRSCRTA